MIEAIAITRDVVIILSAVIITSMVVVVGRVMLALVREAGIVVDTAVSLVDRIRGALLVVRRLTWH